MTQQVGWVYGIHNTANDKWYVGQTLCKRGPRRGRWSQHLGNLRKGKHTNPHLQASFLKYGEDSFEFVVLEECSPSLLDARERYWVAAKDSRNCGYNIRLDPCTNRGNVLSAETRKRIGAASRLRWENHSYRLFMLSREPSFVGRSHGSYARSRVGEASRSRWCDPVQRANYEAKFKARDYTGDRNPAAKLTTSQVVDIRKRYQDGARQVTLAEEFGVSQANISDIVLRRTWKNV